jgi:hypothetical protein
VAFTARQLCELPPQAERLQGRIYDVELPYRRLGRCRMSETVGVEVGTRLEEVAAALSSYEARHGRAVTASRLLGGGVDLGPQDGPTKASAT